MAGIIVKVGKSSMCGSQEKVKTECFKVSLNEVSRDLRLSETL